MAFHLLEFELLVHPIYYIGQASNTGDSPALFEKCCVKVPHIGLVEVGRLGQRPNVPTQGQRGALGRCKTLLTYSAGIRSPASS